METAVIEHVAGCPAVREAAEAGAALVDLWPLTDARQLDNDAKYAEELQVRVTRAFAAVMTGLDVTMADAEFVYEGADEIPGRPQEIVDALLDANDAYDTMGEFSDGGDAGLLYEAARLLGVEWDASVRDAVGRVIADAQEALDDGEAQADDGAPADGETADDMAAADGAAEAFAVVDGDAAGDAADGTASGASADGKAADDTADGGASGSAASLARRFAVALCACHRLVNAVAGPCDDGDANSGAGADVDGGAAARRVLPVLLFVNELRERYGIPRICLTAEQIRTLVGTRESLDDLVEFVAPLAGEEWSKHREDVLWDPDEAKKRAKEEDERRNKEALAAKFAHIKDDPNKPHVEL
ncbi:hypothetical protein BLEM_1147 [Bifidobacterium lemurum]|uniref:Uncharacterized protein n=1 Tax=Bifidobacterium lemurum TaxID=1603886 RepID=A0A261FSA3_9BIFI|nr:hypothetical protein [Bifidobacterium lemurum]OZG62029.1 hypothetical protein BLEM_1147 [Bifidobacterium lemurum]QOL34861.1 hypothetical protein BL8807_02900 [Bifidobacterium lemurum]